MRFFNILKALFYFIIFFVLFYAVVVVLPFAWVTQNRIYFLIGSAAIAALLGFSLRENLDALLERGFQALAMFPLQQLQYIGAGIVFANLVGIPLLIPMIYAKEYFLAMGLLLILDVLGVWAAIAVFRARERREGARERLEYVLDTSVLVDGRITELTRLDLFKGRIVVPSFVVQEIMQLADSTAPAKREKGQRALKVMQHLKESCRRFSLVEYAPKGAKGVDDGLIEYAHDKRAILVTLDANLAKIARVRNVDVINLSEVYLALRPNLSVGDYITVKIVREGKIREQGVGFLDDGTKVVVEDAASLIGATVRVEITNLHMSETGRIIFGKVAD
ncbi:PIN/TRAM domain-containing protein [Coprothermobacteraceae bacterium]|nr:PIN/TRAM domain-containing protein [Coprothermobacteraceae bacterium]